MKTIRVSKEVYEFLKHVRHTYLLDSYNDVLTLLYPRCPKCGYPLVSRLFTDTLECPKCGSVFKLVEQ